MIIDIPTVEGGVFIDGGANTLGTIVRANFLNSLMKSSTATTKEIQTILTKNGIQPDDRVHDQLFKAISKMVTDKVIIVTSTLGDSKELAASQFLANENNKAAKNAQTTANAANDKANQAKQEAYNADQKAVAAQNTANSAKTDAKNADDKAARAILDAKTSYDETLKKRNKDDFRFLTNTLSVESNEFTSIEFSQNKHASTLMGAYQKIEAHSSGQMRFIFRNSKSVTSTQKVSLLKQREGIIALEDSITYLSEMNGYIERSGGIVEIYGMIERSTVGRIKVSLPLVITKVLNAQATIFAEKSDSQTSAENIRILGVNGTSIEILAASRELPVVYSVIGYK